MKAPVVFISDEEIQAELMMQVDAELPYPITQEIVDMVALRMSEALSDEFWDEWETAISDIVFLTLYEETMHCLNEMWEKED